MSPSSTYTPLFIDIETVPMVANFDQIPPRLKPFWEKKAYGLGAKDEGEVRTLFEEKGGLFAEFGKIVAIALGYFKEEERGWKLRVKGLANDNEKILLGQFKTLLERFPSSRPLCGHNVKEFDFPFLARRMLCNDLPLPTALQVEGKKTLGTQPY